LKLRNDITISLFTVSR